MSQTSRAGHRRGRMPVFRARRFFHLSPFTLHSCTGFTLVEMIVTLVVVSIAAVALFGVFTGSVARSADPMLRMQAVAIAQGYLEEALLQSYQDPDGAESGTCEEGARQDYDDVNDYGCINDTAGALDQFGNPLAGLGNYNVAVTVTSVTIGPAGQQVPAWQVVVTVTHDAHPLTVTLTGFRTNY